jgi:hypothetical protein
MGVEVAENSIVVGIAVTGEAVVSAGEVSARAGLSPRGEEDLFSRLRPYSEPITPIIYICMFERYKIKNQPSWGSYKLCPRLYHGLNPLPLLGHLSLKTTEEGTTALSDWIPDLTIW